MTAREQDKNRQDESNGSVEAAEKRFTGNSAGARPVTVCIIDDDPLAATALATILGASSAFKVLGVGHSPAEALSLFYGLRPDILLMDIRMGEKSGLDVGEEILTGDPDAKILYLTTFLDDDYISRALRIGARGYLLKQNYQGLAPALLAVASGQTVFGSEVTSKLPILKASPDSTLESLYAERDISGSEAEMIALVAEGLNNREIAARLFLSEGTIRNRLSAILGKLGLRDRTQLAVFYYRHRP